MRTNPARATFPSWVLPGSAGAGASSGCMPRTTCAQGGCRLVRSPDRRVHSSSRSTRWKSPVCSKRAGLYARGIPLERPEKMRGKERKAPPDVVGSAFMPITAPATTKLPPRMAGSGLQAWFKKHGSLTSLAPAQDNDSFAPVRLVLLSDYSVSSTYSSKPSLKSPSDTRYMCSFPIADSVHATKRSISEKPYPVDWKEQRYGA